MDNPGPIVRGIYRLMEAQAAMPVSQVDSGVTDWPITTYALSQGMWNSLLNELGREKDVEFVFIPSNYGPVTVKLLAREETQA